MGYFQKLYDALNVKGHQDLIIGLKVTATFINGVFLTIGGVESGMVSACRQAAGLFRNILIFLRSF